MDTFDKVFVAFAILLVILLAPVAATMFAESAQLDDAISFCQYNGYDKGIAKVGIFDGSLHYRCSYVADVFEIVPSRGD